MNDRTSEAASAKGGARPDPSAGPMPGERMLGSLPSVYRAGESGDASIGGDLARLLGVFEALFFGDDTAASRTRLIGIERSVQAIPVMFAPLGTALDPQARTPEPLLHWLASWLAFTPHAFFAPERLRHIVAGIVPLYGLRGTRDYLVRLIGLCFDEVRGVKVDDRPSAGLTIGTAVIGSGTHLLRGRAFWFEVVVELDGAAAGRDAAAALERRLRAVIDFAKPAHTAYELRMEPAGGAAHGRANPAA